MFEPGILESILFHLEQAGNQEICGFIYADRFIVFPNRASNPEKAFEADPALVAKTLARYGDPLALFHSHPSGMLKPSPADSQYYKYSIIGRLEQGCLQCIISGINAGSSGSSAHPSARETTNRHTQKAGH